MLFQKNTLKKVIDNFNGDTGILPVNGNMGILPVNWNTGILPVTQAGSLSSQPSKDMHKRFHGVPHLENKQLQSITFRLYDSLPKEVVDEMKLQLKNTKGQDTNDTRHIQLKKKIGTGLDCLIANRLKAYNTGVQASSLFTGMQTSILSYGITGF